MKHRNIHCEPLCIEKDYEFDIHKVEYECDEPYSCLMHFHEVHELIVFEQVEGSYFCGHGESHLQNQDISFTPALEAHNFELTASAKSWYILQFRPEFLTQPEFAHIDTMFLNATHFRLAPSQRNNIQQQVNWLYQAFQQDPRSATSVTLLKLLIHWLSDHAKEVASPQLQISKQTQGFEKIKPVLTLFKKRDFTDLSLPEAAKHCCLSQSHFARLFKSIFRCSFSAYSLQHKLQHAARILGRSNWSVTKVSYELNFASPSHFIHQFKKQFGSTPHQYRTALLNSKKSNS